MLFLKNGIRIGPNTRSFHRPTRCSMLLRILLTGAFLFYYMGLAAQSTHSTPRVHVFRLKPHEDLKKSILQFAKDHRIKAGIVLTCVGSLEQFHLRFANQKDGTKRAGHFEIVSCTGTFADDGSAHLHISVSDSTGHTIGGHLLDDNLVYTTAEIAIAELPDLRFERVLDSTYGYHELLIKPEKKEQP